MGRYDLILHPTHLWLTIHESIAHPTELDRAYGFEANYAGTSFLAPPEEKLGKFRYGPDFMNILADRSAPGSLSACGWDDEGVAPEDFHIVKDGIFVDYQTTREQAMWLDWWYKSRNMPTRSHGCSYARPGAPPNPPGAPHGERPCAPPKYALPYPPCPISPSSPSTPAAPGAASTSIVTYDIAKPGASSTTTPYADRSDSPSARVARSVM